MAVEKFKIGDKVRINPRFRRGDDVRTITGTEVSCGTTYWILNGIGGTGNRWDDEELELASKYPVGTVFKQRNYESGFTRKVVFNNGQWAITEDSDDQTLYGFRKEEDLLEDGEWYPAENDTEEYTLKEVADKLGIPVEKLRIKD